MCGWIGWDGVPSAATRHELRIANVLLKHVIASAFEIKLAGGFWVDSSKVYLNLGGHGCYANNNVKIWRIAVGEGGRFVGLGAIVAQCCTVQTR
jgi:hypothetical protein